uniref:Uncharacterized protein n=1 Tax=Arundo donax TaxID=35708 RepID=A0A0A9AYI5_ARUDO
MERLRPVEIWSEYISLSLSDRVSVRGEGRRPRVSSRRREG